MQTFEIVYTEYNRRGVTYVRGWDREDAKANFRGLFCRARLVSCTLVSTKLVEC